MRHTSEDPDDASSESPSDSDSSLDSSSCTSSDSWLDSSSDSSLEDLEGKTEQKKAPRAEHGSHKLGWLKAFMGNCGLTAEDLRELCRCAVPPLPTTGPKHVLVDRLVEAGQGYRFIDALPPDFVERTCQGMGINVRGSWGARDKMITGLKKQFQGSKHGSIGRQQHHPQKQPKREPTEFKVNATNSKKRNLDGQADHPVKKAKVKSETAPDAFSLQGLDTKKLPASQQQQQRSQPQDDMDDMEPEQREVIEKMKAMFRDNNAQKRSLQGSLDDAHEKLLKELETNGMLRTKLEQYLMREKEIQAHEKEIAKKLAALKKKAPPGAESVTGFMTCKQYQTILKRFGLIELCPGNAADGQQVFHIIAAAHGGPDHTDNYLYALGGSFNQSVGEHLDTVNCFMAGKAKARKAVAIAEKVAKDPSLHKHIRPGTKGIRLYTEGMHKGRTADELFAKGKSLFSAVRLANRSK